MKPVPKRMRQTQGGNASTRGLFFTNEQKHVKTDFSPQYMLVANDIIKKIFDGEYRPASKLPSMRFLAKKYGVSVQVILSALQGLQSLKYVESFPKRGVYVSADIQPAHFYRVGVFMLNQNPFSYCGVLYPLFTALEEHGYTMIIGTNFDGGLNLKQWYSHKRNLDGLIVFGVPSAKEVEHFKRIKIPYILMGAHHSKTVSDELIPEGKMFCDWFVNQYITAPPESRPIYLFGFDPDKQSAIDEAWADYAPEQFYCAEKDDDGNITGVKKI